MESGSVLFANFEQYDLSVKYPKKSMQTGSCFVDKKDPKGKLIVTYMTSRDTLAFGPNCIFRNNEVLNLIYFFT